MNGLEREVAVEALTGNLCEACRGLVRAFLAGADDLDSMCGRCRPLFDAHVKDLMGAYPGRTSHREPLT